MMTFGMGNTYIKSNKSSWYQPFQKATLKPIA